MSESCSGSWADYLDALEAAALEAERLVLEGAAPAVPDLPRPSSAPPVALAARRRAVGTVLDRVAELITDHQRSLGARLAALPQQQVADRARADTLGGQLDLKG